MSLWGPEPFNRDDRLSLTILPPVRERTMSVRMLRLHIAEKYLIIKIQLMIRHDGSTSLETVSGLQIITDYGKLPTHVKCQEATCKLRSERRRRAYECDVAGRNGLSAVLLLGSSDNGLIAKGNGDWSLVNFFTGCDCILRYLHTVVPSLCTIQIF